MRVEKVIIAAVLVGSVGTQWLNAREQREALSLLQGEVDRVSTSVERLQRASSARGLEHEGRPATRWAPAAVQAHLPAVTAPPSVQEVPPVPNLPVVAPFNADAARDQVARAFEREPSDSGWASEALRELRENLSSHMPRTASVRALDCRATLCRLEVDFPMEADFQEAMGRPGAMARLWQGPSVARFERDSARGSVTVIGYLVRPGYPMPVEGPATATP